MKHHARWLGLVVLLASTVYAAQADQIKANHAWIRLLPANLPAGAYVTLDNRGPFAVTLVSAHSDAYRSVMLHQSTTNPAGNSDMHMLDRLLVPAHGQVSLAPGSYHLMLEQAVHPLQPGDTVEVTLDFADGSHLAVPFLVRPANAAD